MDFKKLQAMQLELDNSILSAKPQMTAEERFNKTLVALSVEVSEVANCGEHFKFWKDNKGKVDKERFTFSDCSEELFDDELCMIDWNIGDMPGGYVSEEQAHKTTLVEEASDCLHFVLSLANQIGYEIDEVLALNSDYQKEHLYLKLNYYLSACYNNFSRGNLGFCQTNLRKILFYFMTYVNSLGITTQELEQAYYEKNEENYRRLREGY